MRALESCRSELIQHAFNSYHTGVCLGLPSYKALGPGAQTRTPSPAPITGLWLGLFNPTVRGRVTADIHLIGAPYDATDPDWLFRERWGKGTPDSGSTVLDSIYQVAYGHEAGLGNDAEYPLALAYAALAVRHLAQRMGPTLLGDATQRVLNVGFDSGDFLCIGAIQKDGLIFSENSEVMAPWKGG